MAFQNLKNLIESITTMNYYGQSFFFRPLNLEIKGILLFFKEVLSQYRSIPISPTATKSCFVGIFNMFKFV